MFLGKTRDVWKRELVELFWFTIAITVTVFLLYWYSAKTGISIQDALQSIGSIFVLSYIAYNVLLSLLNLWRRQKCLLDLGGLPSLVGTPFIISVAILLSFYWWNKLSVGWVFIIVLCLRQLLSRLLVVDDGICFYGHLLKWQNIESYSWEGDATPKLKLRTKRQFLGGFQNEIVIDVPNDRREAASILLEQYVSKQEATI
jgi:hypothetical protein